jgi:hypothetical protein
MVAAIGMLHASFIGGILSLVCFQLPGAIVMTGFGLAITSPSVAEWLTAPPAWVRVPSAQRFEKYVLLILSRFFLGSSLDSRMVSLLEQFH